MEHLKKFKIVLLVVLLFVADRILKWMAVNWLSESAQAGFFIIPQFGLQLFKNEKFIGVITLPALISTALLGIFLFFLFTLLRKEVMDGKRVETLALSLAFVGALSNAADRVLLGHVIDYLVIGPSIINLSDILVGTGILIYLKQKN